MSLCTPTRALSASIILLLGACAKPVEKTAAGPSISGNTVVFPVDSPQRTFLTVSAVEPRPRLSTQVTGRLVWDEDTTVRIYSPVEGRVTAVLAQTGDEVKKGAVLARLDSPDFQQVQTDARKAAADFQFAQRSLTRSRDLLDHGAAAGKDVEAAEDAFANAQAEQLRTAERLARYDSAVGSANDGLYGLRSPVAGMVVEKNLNLGQEVRPDLMLANAPQLLAAQFVVSEPRQLWVLLDVTENDMGMLQVGQKLRIRSGAFPKQIFNGELEAIGQSLDPATRTVKARGVVDNSSLLLRSEMYVDVDIDLPAPAAGSVSVVSNAVFTKDGSHFVFVETNPGTFERRKVETGAESAGNVVIQQGLTAHERVLVDGTLLVESLLETGGKS